MLYKFITITDVYFRCGFGGCGCLRIAIPGILITVRKLIITANNIKIDEEDGVCRLGM